MRTSAPTQPIWLEKLLEALGNHWEEKFPHHLSDIREVALMEVVEGTKFVMDRKLKISVTLDESFRINSNCSCLIALNSHDSYFESGLTELGISKATASRLGFSPSGSMETILKKDYFFVNARWAAIYQTLWIAVGQFFRDHPEFGAK